MAPLLVSAAVSRLRAPRRVPAPRPAAGREGAVDHSRLERLLEAATDGWRVDYGLVARSADLAAYRRALALVDADALGREEQLAFWINAYNASALGLVAERMPVRSILDVDGAFTRARFRVGRLDMTLDEIEHGKARRLGEPLVHAALNCCSVGCPPLRAYRGEGLRAALAENMTRYLGDPQRGARADGDRVLLSRVFLWFAGDIAPVGEMPSALGMALGVLRPSRLLAPLRAYLPEGLRDARRVGFLPYDWSLNGG